MRYILITLLLLPMSAMCQTKADYEHAMDRFVKYYNARQGDSIVAMWPPNEKKTMTHMWGDESVNETYEQCGAITSYIYIGKDTEDPNKVAVFSIIVQYKRTRRCSDQIGRRTIYYYIIHL